MGFEISFADKQLRKICESKTAARKALGSLAAKKLFSRLSDLRAAETIDDLIAGNPHKINSVEMLIELDTKYNLIITGSHTWNQLLPNGELNWDQVGRVKILRIEESKHE